ncbi:hypothetical protein [Oculatella sp. LEGE 06141]|nr:hypothetical protein [Oculatella sp. LEGE 06141]
MRIRTGGDRQSPGIAESRFPALLILGNSGGDRGDRAMTAH